MLKKLSHISFYTKKIAQLGSIHPTKRNNRWYLRAARLAKYKELMNAYLRAE